MFGYVNFLFFSFPTLKNQFRSTTLFPFLFRHRCNPLPYTGGGDTCFIRSSFHFIFPRFIFTRFHCNVVVCLITSCHRIFQATGKAKIAQIWKQQKRQNYKFDATLMFSCMSFQCRFWSFTRGASCQSISNEKKIELSSGTPNLDKFRTN